MAAPRPILYDNPRTIVPKKNEETGEVAWNTRLISHQSISSWGRVFGDKVIATAILDLLRCSTVI